MTACCIKIILCPFFLQHLRQAGIAGKFVEFFGPGVSQLSAPDRTTIANMCPEYNATVSFFPVDQVTLKHFKKTSEPQLILNGDCSSQQQNCFCVYSCLHFQSEWTAYLLLLLMSIVIRSFFG